MAQKYVGIDLGSSRVKFAVVTAGLRGVQLLDVFEEAVPPAAAGTKPDEADPYLPALQAALAALRARGLLSEAIGVALPPATLSYRLLSFPFAEERRIAQAVAFEADGQFPVAIDELAHGHAVLPGPTGGGRALLVATKRERVEQLATVFKRAGGDLKAVTSGATALVQVIDADPGSTTPALLERGLQPLSLVVDIGHAYTQLIGVATKGPVAVRTVRRAGRNITAAIARAYGLDEAGAEAAKHRDAFVPHRGHAELTAAQLDAGKLIAGTIEAIVRELEHTRMWLRSTYRYEVVRLVLAGGGAHLGGLAAYLAEHTGLPCDLPHLRVTSNIKTVAPRDMATFGAAIGAAYGAARRPTIQLHDIHAAQGDAGWVQERITSMVAIGVAVMAFGAIDTIVRIKAMDAERDAYLAELETETKKVFGAPVAVAEVDKQLDLVEGEDLTSLIPQRGALEVLAQLTQAATPSDLGKTPYPSQLAGADTGGMGEDSVDAPGAPATPPVTPEVKPATAPEPIDNKAGVVVSDELVFQQVDIRERKLELTVEASRASAQDRLAYRLKDIACLSAIEKGKARGEARKIFEMSMDNNCFYASALAGGSETSSSGTGEDEEGG